MRYFQKHYPSQMFLLSNGRGFRFPTLANGLGAHATESRILLSEFDAAIAAGIGGIKEISAIEYEALKKKEAPRSLNEAISPRRVIELKIAADQAAAAAVAKGKPLTNPIYRSIKKPEAAAGAGGRLTGNSYRPGSVKR